MVLLVLDKKRKALNLLGSVRRSTRERDKDLGRVSYAETLRNSAASSPVSGRRSRSGSDPTQSSHGCASCWSADQHWVHST